MDINHILDAPFASLRHGDPSAVALSLDGTAEWTYAELRERRNRFITQLLDANIGRGDRIGMIMVNSLDYIALYFAVARLGAVAVRLNFRLTASELAGLIDDAACSAVYFHSSRAAQLDPLEGKEAVGLWCCLRDDDSGVPSWAVEADLSVEYAHVDDLPSPAEQDPVVIMYTSGTTGRPKGSVWTHGNSLWFATIQTLQWRFSSRTVALTTGPLYHAGALECFILPALLNNGTGVIMSSGGMSALRIADTVERTQADHALLYPFLIYDILGLEQEQLRKLDPLRLIMSGGDPLEPWALDGIAEKLPGVHLNKGFGLTEGGAQSAVLTHEHTRSHAATVGRPLPLTRIRVVRPDGTDATAGEIGEIWVKAPSISGVYWNRPDATAETFTAGWCRTGDLGTMTDDGFLRIAGRHKDMIRSGGENVYPAEVEGVLAADPLVSTVTVVGVPHPEYTEVGCAVVVPAHAGIDHADIKEALRERARNRLAGFKRPRHYVFIESIPTTSSGKIRKNVLREQFARLGSTRTTPTP